MRALWEHPYSLFIRVSWWGPEHLYALLMIFNVINVVPAHSPAREPLLWKQVIG